DRTLLLEDFLEFRDVFLQFPGGNILLGAEGGRHPRRLAGDHGLLQEAVVGIPVRGDGFTGNQEVLDFLRYQAPVGDIMGTPVLWPDDVSGYGVGTGDMVAAGGETALTDDIREFLRIGHILTGQDVIPNNPLAFPDPEFRTHPGDIGVLEAGHILFKGFEGDLDLPAGFALAVGEVPGIIRRTAGDVRRMLQMRQDTPVFGVALWHEEEAHTAHPVPFVVIHHFLEDGGETSYFPEIPHVLYSPQNLAGLLWRAAGDIGVDNLFRMGPYPVENFVPVNAVTGKDDGLRLQRFSWIHVRKVACPHRHIGFTGAVNVDLGLEFMAAPDGLHGHAGNLISLFQDVNHHDVEEQIDVVLIHHVED